MIQPSIETMFAKFGVNRYALVSATAKCARIATNEYVEQRENAERQIEAKFTDKSISALVGKEFSDRKAVEIALGRLSRGEYRIVEPPLDENGILLCDEEA